MAFTSIAKQAFSLSPAPQSCFQHQMRDVPDGLQPLPWLPQQLPTELARNCVPNTMCPRVLKTKPALAGESWRAAAFASMMPWEQTAPSLTCAANTPVPRFLLVQEVTTINLPRTALPPSLYPLSPPIAQAQWICSGPFLGSPTKVWARIRQICLSCHKYLSGSGGPKPAAGLGVGAGKVLPEALPAFP